MNTRKLLRIYVITISFFMVLSGFGQQFTSGGYQGGTHGNIKYSLWSGAVDNDWSNPANWCPAVIPDEEDAVVIPASVSIMPEVKSSGMKCKSLNIEPGAELKIKDGYILTVNGTEVQ